MECTVKKEVEVTLKLTGDEAILLRDLLFEMDGSDISNIINEFTKEVIDSTNRLTVKIYEELNNLEL